MGMVEKQNVYVCMGVYESASLSAGTNYSLSKQWSAATARRQEANSYNETRFEVATAVARKWSDRYKCGRLSLFFRIRWDVSVERCFAQNSFR